MQHFKLIISDEADALSLILSSVALSLLLFCSEKVKF